MRFTQITFRHMPHLPAIGERIREISGKLEERYPEILRCRVGVERFGRGKSANAFKVTVEVRLAEGDLACDFQGADIEAALRAAFAELGQRLEKKSGRKRAA